MVTRGERERSIVRLQVVTRGERERERSIVRLEVVTRGERERDPLSGWRW